MRVSGNALGYDDDDDVDLLGPSGLESVGRCNGFICSLDGMFPACDSPCVICRCHDPERLVIDCVVSACSVFRYCSRPHLVRTKRC